ncbi:MAG: AAA family ATPase [Cryomorphaceae bacterium]|jgi:superfamily I DNA and/or RNA helicase|nr:AAA family ATPase [Cryomorphaceae bacterium]
MNKTVITSKFRTLREQLVNLKYKVNTEIFESLCYLHNYVLKNKDNVESKNELTNIFHDIFIEIFMPLRPEEPYKEYDDKSINNRFYFGPADKLHDEVKYIYDLNIYSKVWLKDISAFYNVKSKEYKHYNFNISSPKILSKKKRGHYTKIKPISQSNIRGLITKHLQEYIDPDKPVKPNISDIYSDYRFEFLNSLYEENKVKNRFFQQMKYKQFNELLYKKQAILNLKVLKYNQVEEYNEEEDEKKAWIVKLSPSEHDYLSKYNLFKDNPFVYLYRYTYKDEINHSSFTPSTAEYFGKVLSINEDKNILTIKIKADDFSVSKQKYFTGIVLRQDYITYQREKDAVNHFIDNKANLPLKKLFVNHELPDEFYDLEINDFCNENLNLSQKQAVNYAIKSKSFFSIHGPPGTGKTKVCAEIIMQALKFKPNSRILVTCASNEATDNILNSFVKILPTELQDLVLRIGTEEKTSENDFSLNFKVKNSHLFDEKILSLKKRREDNLKLINNSQNYVKDNQPKLELLNKNREIIQAKLYSIKDKGTLKEKAIGIIPEIEELKNINTLNNNEKEEIINQIKLLESEKENNELQLNDIDKDIQKKQNEINNKNEIINTTYEENRQIEVELKINEKQLKETVINRNPVVVFSTNNHSAILSKYNAKQFDLLLIDEITQSTEPSALIPINISNKVIIAGDHHQLPPTVFLKNKDYDEELNPDYEKERIRCYQMLSTSLFERLYDHIKDNSLYCIFLDTQYRMNPMIIDFLNDTIYNSSKLKSDISTNDHFLSNGMFGTSLVFINHSKFESKEYSSDEFSASKVEYSNEREVELIQKIVNKYLKNGFSNKELGIISPYKSQVRKLNRVLEQEGLVARTVDSFQGQEKEIIILSLVRSNDQYNQNKKTKSAIKRIGFLVDERRFNVAITRFKRKLIIIGNEDTVSISNNDVQEYYDVYENKNKPLYYKSLINYIKSKGKFIPEFNLDNYLNNENKITLTSNNENNRNKISKEFHKALLQKFHDVIIKELKQEIKIIKNDKTISDEDKINRISDKITVSLSQIKEDNTPFLEKLSKLSRKYINTANFYYKASVESNDLIDLEWGGIITNYGRALEQELLDKIFVPFKDNITSNEDHLEEIIKLKKDKDLKMLVEFILKNKKLAIGNMEYLLNTIIHSNERKDLFLIHSFRTFLNSMKNAKYIFQRDGLCNDLKKSTKYRNPSSHAGIIINRDFCDEAKSYIEQIIKNVILIN